MEKSNNKTKNKTEKELTEQEKIKIEYNEYKEDFCDLGNTVNNDDYPIIQKIIFIITGVLNFLIGLSLYFILKDNKKYTWQPSYFLLGAVIGFLISLVEGVCTILEYLVK